MSNIALIVAMDKNRVIGKNGDIPWKGRLRADMEHFSLTTQGHVVVMGRKTWQSLPERFRPLPKRENLVLTRDTRLNAKGCGEIYDPSVIERISDFREVFVIGGSEIYKMFLPVARRILVTHVETIVEGGDTFFPVILDEWFSKPIFQKKTDQQNQFNFNVVEYTRR